MLFEMVSHAYEKSENPQTLIKLGDLNLLLQSSYGSYLAIISEQAIPGHLCS